ncbi:MAG: AAA-like domain-containing protein [Bacteroidota bacterium]
MNDGVQIHRRYFQAGGSLPTNLPSYIERRADKTLYKNLKAGEFCFVLTARQMGKSSLKVKIMERLESEGWSNASIDLTAFGTTDFSTEQWYYSFLFEIADALNLEDVFDEWWSTKSMLTPVARMTLFWEEVLLRRSAAPIAIYIDEVDTMLSLDKEKFSTDDFFAGIRAAYNLRGSKPQFKRLNFCIFGVAAPKDLMNDPDRTPFNIGVDIPLNYFSSSESAILKEGIPTSKNVADAILKRVIYWTEGQPYLTQKIFQVLVDQENNPTTLLKPLEQIQLEDVDAMVDRLVEALFFKGNTVSNDTHFSNINVRIIRNDRYNLLMLELYRQLLNKQTVVANNKSPEQLYLKLAGITREQDGQLLINNPIYRNIFDQEWLEGAYNTIDRPLATDLQRWLNNNRTQDALLNGQILKNAENWAKDRSDLTAQERDFLEASRIQAIEKREEKLRQQEKERQQKLLKRALVAAVLAAIIAIALAIVAFQKNSLATEAAEKERLAAETAQKNKIALEQEVENNAIGRYNRYLIQGRAYQDRGAYEQALQKYEEAIATVENFNHATRSDFLMQVAQGKLADSLKTALAASVDEEIRFDQFLKEGDLLKKQGKYFYVDAQNQYQNALSLEVNALNKSIAQGRLNEMKGLLDAVYEDFIRAGDTFLRAKGYKEALRAYKAAKRIVNTDAIQQKIDVCTAEIDKQ